MCVLFDHTLRDPSKFKIATPDFCVGNWKTPEHWMCFPKENMDVWNMQPNGLYQLSTEPGGDYMTEEEHKKYIKDRVQRIYRNPKKK